MEAADRVRLELEQALTERDEARTAPKRTSSRSRMRVRAPEIEQVLAAERDLARGRADEDQRRAAEAQRTVEEAQRRADQAQRRADEVHQRIEEEQRRAAEEINQVRASFEADPRRRPRRARGRRSAAPVHADRLVAALREIDSADSVSATLAAIRRAAGLHAARGGVRRAAVARVGDPWCGVAQPRASLRSRQFDWHRWRGRPTACGCSRRERRCARVAGLSVGRMAVATPLLLDGQAVGVLYGDEGLEGTIDAQWIDALDAVPVTVPRGSDTSRVADCPGQQVAER